MEKTQDISPAIHNIYIFYGEEEYLAEGYLQKITDTVMEKAWEAFHIIKIKATELEWPEFISRCEEYPLGSSRKVIIIREAEKLTLSQKEKLAAYLKNPPSFAIFVFWFIPTLKKTNISAILNCPALEKICLQKGLIIDFTLREEEKIKWVKERFFQNDIEIKTSQAQFLLDCCGGNLRIIESEIEKIKNFLWPRKSISEEELKQIVSFTSYSHIFFLLDCIGAKATTAALESLDLLLKEKKEPLMLISSLANHFRLLCQVKSLSRERKTAKEIASFLKQHPYKINKYIKQAQNFSENFLKKALELLLRADISIKTSRQDPRFIMEFLIITLCAGGGR